MNLDTTVYSIHIIITTIIILYSQVTYVSCSDPSVTKRYPRKKSCLPRQINLQLVRSTKNEQLLYAQVCALGGSRVRIPDITRSAIANCIILIGFKTRSQSQVHQIFLPIKVIRTVRKQITEKILQIKITQICAKFIISIRNLFAQILQQFLCPPFFPNSPYSFLWLTLYNIQRSTSYTNNEKYCRPKIIYILWWSAGF